MSLKMCRYLDGINSDASNHLNLVDNEYTAVYTVYILEILEYWSTL